MENVVQQVGVKLHIRPALRCLSQF